MTRVFAGAPVVRTDLARIPYAAELAEVDTGRSRKGLFIGSDIGTNDWMGGLQVTQQQRLLSDEELFTVYKMVPDVRASIDSLVRVISTFNYNVSANLDVTDPRYPVAQDLAEEVRRFIEAPNADDTWQDVVSKLARDTFIYDAMAGENVFDGNDGKIEEFVVLPGGTVRPVKDSHGRTMGYVQEMPNGKVADFDTEQIVYMNLFPNSRLSGGTPLIETIINEIITMMRSSKHVMLAFDADEVPPGILVIAGMAGRNADRTVAGLKNMKGSDHKLRVITTNNPSGVQAKWVEFRHTPKDLDMREIVNDTRRTIWRVFGVKPVSMGDTEMIPRATAEVQVEAEASGLIRPFLELFQAKINKRLIPLIVGDPDLAMLVKYEYDLEEQFTAEEKRAESGMDLIDFDRAALTVNEMREKRGRPPVAFGDVPLLRTNNGHIPLNVLVEAGGVHALLEPENAVTTEPVGVIDPESPGPDAGEGGPGEATINATMVPVNADAVISNPLTVYSRSKRRGTGSWGRLPPHAGCGCEPDRKVRNQGMLPSEWQPGSRFEDYRTIPLGHLGDTLIAYSREVNPLYLQARTEMLSIFRSVTNEDGEIPMDQAQQAGARAAAVLSALAEKWAATTRPLYRAAGKAGRDAVVAFSADPYVISDWEEKSYAFADQAMGYLNGTRGLLTDLRSDMRAILTSTVVRSRTDTETRADPTMATGLQAETLDQVRRSFNRNQHRIDNWSGKLVELSNQLAVAGLISAGIEASGFDEDGTPIRTKVEWYAEWAAVDDSRTCPTCSGLSGRGFVPVRSLPTYPGGATECGGRCRCILVFWTRAEVDDGTAIILSGE